MQDFGLITILDGCQQRGNLPRAHTRRILAVTLPGETDVTAGTFSVAFCFEQFGQSDKRHLVEHGITHIVESRTAEPVLGHLHIAHFAVDGIAAVAHDGVFVGTVCRHVQPLRVHLQGLFQPPFAHQLRLAISAIHLGAFGGCRQQTVHIAGVQLTELLTHLLELGVTGEIAVNHHISPIIGDESFAGQCVRTHSAEQRQRLCLRAEEGAEIGQSGHALALNLVVAVLACQLQSPFGVHLCRIATERLIHSANLHQLHQSLFLVGGF